MIKISIIIPILNEEKNIISLLEHLEQHSSKKNSFELLIVDGGSTDESISKIENYIKNRHHIALISSERGRAKQMNQGRLQANGAILYFLHADSYPPKNFDQYLIDEVKKGNLAGCFKMKFNHPHWWLKLASWFTQFNWSACRGGDQSQYITATLFDEIGGFNEDYIIYEDQILIKELYKRNQFTVIQKWICTSARLYERKGIWNLQYHFWAIYIKKWLGADATTLYHYYKKHIAS
jgi:rSAM/selenodomain-associated transferase 2